MGRPKVGYELDGVKVPGVTTILSRFKEGGGLLYWAWDQGRQGLDFRDTSSKAANAGTLAHAMIEADIRGHPANTSILGPQDDATKVNARHAFEAYREWKKRSRVKPVVGATELSLVSTKYRFGGTLDAMLMGKKLILGDWKTSGGIYTDMLLQVAGGYSLLWEEHYPDWRLEGIEILRISKPNEPGDPISFHDHYWGPELFSMCQRQFLLLREAYDLDKRIKGLI